MAQPALKKDLTDVEGASLEVAGQKSVYDEGLHDRFLLWKDHSGNSVGRIAAMINRSAALVSQYINRKYPGNVAEIEKDIASLLRREEDLEFVSKEEVFCNTMPAKLIWEVLQFCDETRDMGVAVGPAGIGKTQTCNEYKRKNRGTIFITADIATRSVGSVLALLAKKVGGTQRLNSNSNLLHAIIDRLKHSRRLVLIDEAHFLSWEAFEVVRKIHDCAGVGVAYVGMERLYDQMKGTNNRAYLFDQIYSRIAIKRDDLRIQRADIKLIADSAWPGLDKACIDYLFKKAQGKGKLRTVSKLLQVAVKMHGEFKAPMNIALLKQAARFLMKQ